MFDKTRSTEKLGENASARIPRNNIPTVTAVRVVTTFSKRFLTEFRFNYARGPAPKKRFRRVRSKYFVRESFSRIPKRRFGAINVGTSNGSSDNGRNVRSVPGTIAEPRRNYYVNKSSDRGFIRRAKYVVPSSALEHDTRVLGDGNGLCRTFRSSDASETTSDFSRNHAFKYRRRGAKRSLPLKCIRVPLTSAHIVDAGVFFSSFYKRHFFAFPFRFPSTRSWMSGPLRRYIYSARK